MRFRSVKVVNVIRFRHLNRQNAFLIPYESDQVSLAAVLGKGGIFLIRKNGEIAFRVIPTANKLQSRRESICDFVWPFSATCSSDCHCACSILPISSCYGSCSDYVESAEEWKLFNLI